MSGDQLDLDTTTPEQEARDLLDRMGVGGAQAMSTGDVVELANLVAEVRRLRDKVERATTVRNGWRNNHVDCGCAWCDLWKDLDDALDRDHAAPNPIP